MKILQLIQEKGIVLGIISPFNIKTIATFFVLGTALCFSCIQLCSEASDFQEYIFLIHTISTFILCVTILSIFVMENQTIFKLLEDFQGIIDKSKSSTLNMNLFYKQKLYLDKIQGLNTQHRRKSIRNSIHELKHGVKSSIICS